MNLKIKKLFDCDPIFDLTDEQIEHLSEIIHLDEKTKEMLLNYKDVLNILDIDFSIENAEQSIDLSDFIDDMSEDEKLVFFDFLDDYYEYSTLKKCFKDGYYFYNAKPLIIYDDYFFEHNFNCEDEFLLEYTNKKFDLYNLGDEYVIISEEDLFDDISYENLYEIAVYKIIKEDLENDPSLFNINMLENVVRDCEYSYSDSGISDDIIENLINYKYSDDEKYGNDLIREAKELGYSFKTEMPIKDDYENEDEYEKAFEEWVEETTEDIENNIHELAEKYFNTYYDGSIYLYYESIYGGYKAIEEMINDGRVDIDCMADKIEEIISSETNLYDYYFTRVYGDLPRFRDTVEVDGKEYYIYEITEDMI